MSGGWKVAAYSNVAIMDNAAVTHAMLVIHGGGRDAAATFAGMTQAATQAGVAANTLVVAPWFKTAQDKPRPNEAIWTDDGWTVGDSAVTPPGLSSFTVADEIIAALADRTRFPRLAWITVIGHSSGGQFTNRYATFGQEPHALTGSIVVNYVAANPSSFVYFNSARPAGNGTFATPNTGACPNYNTYKYGMGGRTGYVAPLTPHQAEATYLSRRVTILNGAGDDYQNGDMDSSCGANLQGPNRVTRGAEFFNLMHSIDPSAPHDRIVVPGVDHDHYALFDSPLASPVLFGRAAAASTTGQ